MNIEIIKLRGNAVIPEFHSGGAAAIDLRACIDSELWIGDESRLIPTGLSMHIHDPDVAGFIIPRSGLGHKHGVVLGNGVGLIDSDYQGEILVSLICRKSRKVVVTPGDRIAQMFFTPIIRPTFIVVDQFSESSERGINGFGSSGVK